MLSPLRSATTRFLWTDWVDQICLLFVFRYISASWVNPCDHIFSMTAQLAAISGRISHNKGSGPPSAKRIAGVELLASSPTVFVFSGRLLRS